MPFGTSRTMLADDRRLPGAAETPGLMLGTAEVVALLLSLSEGYPPLTPGLPL